MGICGGGVLLENHKIRRLSRLQAAGQVVGRALHCGVPVEHQSVSKEHARLERDADGALLLEDLESTNGTFVNSQRLTAKTKLKVRPDDAVRFGRASIFHALDPSGFHAYLDLLQRFGL